MRGDGGDLPTFNTALKREHKRRFLRTGRQLSRTDLLFMTLGSTHEYAHTHTFTLMDISPDFSHNLFT